MLDELQQGNALAGATGAGLAAGGAEYLLGQLYPDKSLSSLSEVEKQTIAALTTLAASIAGGLTGGDLAAAVDGGKAGRNEVENNALSLPKGMTEAGQAATSWIKYAHDNNHAVGGATSSYLNGDNRFKGGLISGAASGIGYGIGKAATTSLDKWVNPTWKNYEWVDMDMGISKPLPLDPRPAVIGSIIASGATETIGQVSSKAASSLKEGGK